MRVTKVSAVLASVALGGLLGAIAVEAVLRVLPVQNGLFAADPTSGWGVHHLAARVRYTFSEAWDLRNVHRGVTNNMGYVAPFDYRSGEDTVVVVGDSFIEALMNDYDDTLQGQLAKQLKTGPVVTNFGTSGASLPDYLALGPPVSQRFRVRWVVILVVAGDFSDAFAPLPGYFRWSAGENPPVQLVPRHLSSPPERFLRTLAIVRYTRGNLKFSLDHLLHSSVRGSPEACRPETLQFGDAELVKAYVESLPVAWGVPASHIILILDADRAELYRTNGVTASARCPTRDLWARRLLAQIARVHGERVIEMEGIFGAYFRATRQRVDYSPVDWHWNAVGHRLAADEVARVMQSADPADASSP